MNLLILNYTASVVNFKMYYGISSTMIKFAFTNLISLSISVAKLFINYLIKKRIDANCKIDVVNCSMDVFI